MHPHAWTLFFFNPHNGTLGKVLLQSPRCLFLLVKNMERTPLREILVGLIFD